MADDETITGERERERLRSAERRRKRGVPLREKIRLQAQQAGLVRYVSEKPCPRGHVGERYTSGGGCCACATINLETRRRAKGISPRKSAMSKTEFRAKRRVLDRKWKAKNRKRLAEEAKAYYWANKEECDARNLARARNNPDVAVARAAAYKARVLKAEGFYTAVDVAEMLRRQKGRCANCKKDIRKKRHVDHIVPLARGGTNWPNNLQLLCPLCNHSKHAKDPIAWAQENGRLL